MARPRPRLLILVLLVLSLQAAAQPTGPIDLQAIDPADHTQDRWYLDSIDGRPSGYWHEWLTIQDGHILTGYEVYAVQKHGGQTSERRLRVQWRETLDYQPISITVQQANASETITQTYRFTESGIELTSEQSERVTTQSLAPIQGEYLTAAQEEIATQLRRAGGSDAFELRCIDPLIGITPIVTRYQKRPVPDGADKLDKDRPAYASAWTRTFSVLPGFEMRCYADERGRAVGLCYESDGARHASHLSDASVTEAAFDPPEMARRSVVVPDQPIKDARKQRKMVYELIYTGQDQSLVPVQTSHQAVEQLGAGRARVTVDLEHESGQDARDRDKPTQAHRAATIRADHRDERVRSLAQTAVSKLDGLAGQRQRAQACTQFVWANMRGGALSVGDATASEVARQRRGDCTEYSVLLAAILRANGIPSRCVTGLVYSEAPFAGQRDVFIHHMWVQAWIDDEAGGGRWLDLDAAQRRYSAGHIALGVSDLGEGWVADQVSLIPLTRGLKIKVIETGASD